MYLKEPVGETYCRFAKMHGLDVGSPEDLDRSFKLNYKLAVKLSLQWNMQLLHTLTFFVQTPIDYSALQSADVVRVQQEEREWWRALVLKVFRCGSTEVRTAAETTLHKHADIVIAHPCTRMKGGGVHIVRRSADEMEA